MVGAVPHEMETKSFLRNSSLLLLLLVYWVPPEWRVGLRGLEFPLRGRGQRWGWLWPLRGVPGRVCPHPRTWARLVQDFRGGPHFWRGRPPCSSFLVLHVGLGGEDWPGERLDLLGLGQTPLVVSWVLGLEGRLGGEGGQQVPARRPQVTAACTIQIFTF